MRNYKRWTPPERAFLRAAWDNPHLSRQDIADLMGRTYDAIHGAAAWLDLGGRPEYVPPHDPHRAMMDRLTWLYGDPYARIEHNKPDVEAWERLGRCKS